VLRPGVVYIGPDLGHLNVHGASMPVVGQVNEARHATHGADPTRHRQSQPNGTHQVSVEQLAPSSRRNHKGAQIR
jgi:hypothetical protein